MCVRAYSLMCTSTGVCTCACSRPFGRNQAVPGLASQQRHYYPCTAYTTSKITLNKQSPDCSWPPLQCGLSGQNSRLLIGCSASLRQVKVLWVVGWRRCRDTRVNYSKELKVYACSHTYVQFNSFCCVLLFIINLCQTQHRLSEWWIRLDRLQKCQLCLDQQQLHNTCTP